MSDPYRPAYYPPPATAGSPYHPQDYADASDQYGPLTTRHRPNHSGAGSGSYYPVGASSLPNIASTPTSHSRTDKVYHRSLKPS